MNKGQTYILWIVAALMVYNLFINNKIKTDISSYRSKISVLQQKIDSVNILNRELDNKINSLHSQIDIIDVDINKVQDKISKIKFKANEKINAVDNLTFTELEQYFTARYSKQIRRLNNTVEGSDSETSDQGSD